MRTGPAVRVFSTPRDLAEEAASSVRSLAAQVVAHGNRFGLALSGGRTPQDLYALLAEAKAGALPYHHMEIFWSDERAVPPDHPQSNYALAWRAWLSRAPLPAAHVHRIPVEEDPQQAAARYEAELRRVLGDPPRLDLVLLGVGRDGHTASLFPDSPALFDDRLVVATAAPEPPHVRITFTLRMIRLASRVLVLASGSDKARAMRRALEDEPSTTVPASLLRWPQVCWFLDEAAAAELARR